MRSNPPVVPADTSPDVWRRQMKAIGARSVTDRMNEWAALNNAVSAMEADSVRRRRPGYTDRQVFLALVRRRYGDELAGKVWPESLAVEP